MNETAIAKTEPAPLTVGARGLNLDNSDDVMRFASTVCREGLAPKGMEAPGKIFVAIQHGREVGLAPMQAIQSIAVVHGRPCLWGDALPALVRSSGLCKYIKETLHGEGDKMFAVCEAARNDDESVATQQFSVADAKRAGKWNPAKGGPWKSYPQRMLQMRARAWCLRDLFPDVLRGLRVVEEVQDYTPTAPKTIAIAPANPAPQVEPDDDSIVDAEIVASPTPEATHDKLPYENSDALDGDDGAITAEEAEEIRRAEMEGGR